MRHIANQGNGWDHTPYWRYLESVKNEMPAYIYTFAADSKNYDLTSPDSLHDSWLISWAVNETPSNLHPKKRHVSINLKLLASKHDRIIHLTYEQVQFYQARNQNTDSLEDINGHGDLLVHEILMLQPKLFSHELLFASGYTFLVHFSTFKNTVENIR